jgi:lipopolysaccharide export system protein LptA
MNTCTGRTLYLPGKVIGALGLAVLILSAVSLPASGQKQAVQQFQDITVKADVIQGTPKGGKMVMEAIGNPTVLTKDSQIKATKMTFEVAGKEGITTGRMEGNVNLRTRVPGRGQNGSKEPDTIISGTGNTLTMDRARQTTELSGNVRITTRYEPDDGRSTTATSQRATLNQAAGTTQLAGNVNVKANSGGGRAVAASGQNATLYRDKNEAHMQGNVRFEVTDPGNLAGPAKGTAETFTYNLRSGAWTLRGSGQTQTVIELTVPEGGGRPTGEAGNR